MHLVSLSRQTVRIAAADLDVTLEEGESIWTESSYKYEAGRRVRAPRSCRLRRRFDFSGSTAIIRSR